MIAGRGLKVEVNYPKEYDIATLFSSYAVVEDEIKTREAQLEILRTELKDRVRLAPGHTIDVETAGATLQEATRETLDKVGVKKLIGELEFKRLCKVTKYEIFKVFPTQESWEKFKNFGKGDQSD